MFGFGKFATAGSVASLATLAISSAAFACQTPSRGSDQGEKGTKQVAASCPVSGNALLQNVSYSTGHGSFSSLSGHVTSGDRVTATFTVPARCSVVATLVAYSAPSAAFDAKTADQQTVVDSAGGTAFAAGSHSLTVTVPGCYFQVDFVREGLIAKLGPAGSNNFYSPQGRLIGGANGGSHSCASSSGGPTPTPTPTPCASSPELSNVSYLLGGSKTVATLRGQVVSGETVAVTFTVPANCSMPLTLAAYEAPLPYFSAASAPQQKLVAQQNGTYTSGVHTMTVTVPSCMFQVDFVHGVPAIEHFGPEFYGARLISADNGGSTSCASSSTGTPTPSPSPTGTPTPSPSPSGTPTPSPTGTPAPTGTPTGTPAPTGTPTSHTTPPSTPSGGVQAISTSSSPTPGGVLSLATDTPATGAHIALGSALILLLAGLGLVIAGRSRRENI